MNPSAPGIVAGYLSIDHSVSIAVGIEPGHTALVDRRLSPDEGRLGGTVTQIVFGLAAESNPVEAISWVGPDRAGSQVVATLDEAGVGTAGINSRHFERTPRTWLCYAPNGASYCIYDPGGPLPTALSPAQSALATAAPWAVITAGPPGPASQLLDLLDLAALLVWSVKADPISFPPPLVRRLAARAQVILWSRAETAFLANLLGPDWTTQAAARGALLVETRGAEGCVHYGRDETTAYRTHRVVSVQDPTGAGDRFVAGVLSALLRDEPPATAVRAGISAAGRFLVQRAHEEQLPTQETDPQSPSGQSRLRDRSETGRAGPRSEAEQCPASPPPAPAASEGNP